MGRLEEQIKSIAREYGAPLVGIASRESLREAPPSSDPDYLMPSTRSVVSFAVPLDGKAIRAFLGKKDWLSHCHDRKSAGQVLYRSTDSLVDLLKSKGFEARGVDLNAVYRPEPDANDVTEMTEFIPDFSLRYAAVAAGIGRLGWSGNVVTPEYGGIVELGAVLTSAELEPDQVLIENPCDRCKLCTAVCPVEMMAKKEGVSVRIAGITDEIAKKRPNSCCFIGCSGYHGMSPRKKWSTWSPYRMDYPLPQDKSTLDALNTRLLKADPEMQLEDTIYTDYRKAIVDLDWLQTPTCGNCRNVCWVRREDRKENYRLLVNSGIVVLGPDGERVATGANAEVLELDTPYTVRVAVDREEFKRKVASESSANGHRGVTPMDTEVLRSIFKQDGNSQTTAEMRPQCGQFQVGRSDSTGANKKTPV